MTWQPLAVFDNAGELVKIRGVLILQLPFVEGVVIRGLFMCSEDCLPKQPIVQTWKRR